MKNTFGDKVLFMFLILIYFDMMCATALNQLKAMLKMVKMASMHFIVPLLLNRFYPTLNHRVRGIQYSSIFCTKPILITGSTFYIELTGV